MLFESKHIFFVYYYFTLLSYMSISLYLQLYIFCDIINVLNQFFLFQMNVAIKEIPDVITETKMVLSNGLGDSMPLCVEIFLKTVDGDTMTLETWSIGLLAESAFDPFCSRHLVYTLYNRLGVLLKSLVSVSRVIPAYRYSRQQSHDSFQIHHRIYAGEPQIHTLGK